MKKWICTVCGYIHEGDEPPEECPICGAPKSAFEPYFEDSGQTGPASRPVVPIVKPASDDPQKAAFSLSYGLYIISSRDGDRLNAQTANTVFQLTSEPMRLAICLNKNNFTNEIISRSGIFTVTTLGKSGYGLIPGFGFRSGRDTDKFAGVEYELSPTVNCPVPKPAVAFLECRVAEQMTMDVGTHTLFVADIVGGRVYDTKEEPMTYADYRKLKAANAEK